MALVAFYIVGILIVLWGAFICASSVRNEILFRKEQEQRLKMPMTPAQLAELEMNLDLNTSGVIANNDRAIAEIEDTLLPLLPTEERLKILQERAERDIGAIAKLPSVLISPQQTVTTVSQPPGGQAKHMDDVKRHALNNKRIANYQICARANHTNTHAGYCMMCGYITDTYTATNSLNDKVLSELMQLPYNQAVRFLPCDWCKATMPSNETICPHCGAQQWYRR